MWTKTGKTCLENFEAKTPLNIIFSHIMRENISRLFFPVRFLPSLPGTTRNFLLRILSQLGGSKVATEERKKYICKNEIENSDSKVQGVQK